MNHQLRESFNFTIKESENIFDQSRMDLTSGLSILANIILPNCELISF